MDEQTKILVCVGAAVAAKRAALNRRRGDFDRLRGNVGVLECPRMPRECSTRSGGTSEALAPPHRARVADLDVDAAVP